MAAPPPRIGKFAGGAKIGQTVPNRAKPGQPARKAGGQPVSNRVDRKRKPPKLKAAAPLGLGLINR